MQFLNYRVRAGLLFLMSYPAMALAQPVSLADCARIPDDGKRLQCYDQLAAAHAAREEAARVASPDATPDAEPPLPSMSAAPGAKSFLSDHWELEAEYKRGTFAFRPHQANYLLATYSDSPNNAPYLPFRRFVPGSGDLSRTELAFQLGFKMKFAENLMAKPVDLWFGYTQNSFWQAGNHEASSPFRESNYQPELMAVMPVKVGLLGMRMRFINLGLVHQSNGQTSTLSRSWNRVYAQIGMEKGDFTLLARVWQRLNEDASEDDNPDIVDYMGRGDLVGTYRWRGHELSALARYNFDTNKGAAQIGWAFPLSAQLKGYVQVFSGYGQSLIDYNHSQNTVGFGILVGY